MSFSIAMLISEITSYFVSSNSKASIQEQKELETTSLMDLLESGFYLKTTTSQSQPQKKDDKDKFIIDMDKFEQYQNIENCISFMKVLHHFGNHIKS